MVKDKNDAPKHLIVGAGPTGLILAFNLARSFEKDGEDNSTINEKLKIIEARSEGDSDNPAIIVLRNHTIKKLQKLDPGIITELKKSCFSKVRKTYWPTLKCGRRNFPIIGCKEYTSEQMSVPIGTLNKVLIDRLYEKFGIKVEWGRPLQDVEKIEGDKFHCKAVVGYKKNTKEETEKEPEKITYSSISLACGIGGAKKLSEKRNGKERNIGIKIEEKYTTPSVVAKFQCTSNSSDMRPSQNQIATGNYIKYNGTYVVVDTLRYQEGGVQKIAFCANLPPKLENASEAEKKRFIKDCMKEIKKLYPQTFSDLDPNNGLQEHHDVEAVSARANFFAKDKFRMLVVGDAAVVTPYLLGNELNEVITKYIDLAVKPILEIDKNPEKPCSKAFKKFSDSCEKNMFSYFRNPSYYYRDPAGATKKDGKPSKPNFLMSSATVLLAGPLYAKPKEGPSKCF